MQKDFNEKSMKSGIIMSAAFRIILHMLAPDKIFFNKRNFPVGNILFVPVENIAVSASLVVFFFFFAKKDLETARFGSDRIGTQHNKVPLMVMMMRSMRNLNLHNHHLQSWLSVAFIAVATEEEEEEEEEAYGYETHVCTPDRLTAVAQRIHSHLQSGCRDNGQHEETLVFLQESQESEFRAGVTYCWEEKEDRSAALRKSIGSRFPFKRLAAISL
jgi:hypothetical protein